MLNGFATGGSQMASGDPIRFQCVNGKLAMVTYVALLVNQMETVIAHAEELLFEPELVVRGSTGPAKTA
jgi:hypothetical protein